MMDVLTQDVVKGLTQKRWLILVVSCLINLFIGSMYAWSSLSAPLAAELGVDNLSIVFSVTNGIAFVMMIIGGILNDKYGPRWIVFTGGLLYGIGMLISGQAHSVNHVILGYGIILGLGSSMIYGCTINNTIKFFPDKRGMAGGMATAFYGISSVIFAPLSDIITNAIGVRNTFRILGIAVLLVVCIGSLVLQKCPKGFLPEGYIPPAKRRERTTEDKKPTEMLQMSVFYVMLAMFACGTTFGMMIISNAKGIAVNMVGASSMVATLFVSVICLFNTAGRLIAGTLSDKLGRINTLTFAMLMALGGLVVLVVASNTASMLCFSIGVIMVGICFGTFMGVFPGFCTDRFGAKHNAVNYGFMWIGVCIAGIVGPTSLVKIYGATGSYSIAFGIAIGLGIIGILLSIVYRKMTR